MIRFVSAALLPVGSSATLAHDLEPPLGETAASAAMRYCQTLGVRAAWGAQARFLGAPAAFKYIGSGG